MITIPLTKGEWKREQELKQITGMTKFRRCPLGEFNTARAQIITLPPMEVRQALEIMSNGDCGEM